MRIRRSGPEYIHSRVAKVLSEVHVEVVKGVFDIVSGHEAEYPMKPLSSGQCRAACNEIEAVV